MNGSFPRTPSFITYVTSDPLSEVLKPRYFDREMSRFRPGVIILVEAKSNSPDGLPDYALCLVITADEKHGVLTRDIVWPKAPPAA